MCAWLWLNLDGVVFVGQVEDQAWAWHTFSHEIAHHLGYDHGVIRARRPMIDQPLLSE